MKLNSMNDDIERLVKFVQSHPRLFVLTGAGVSTDSGIPDYRDQNGDWKTARPIQGPDFIRSEAVRKRYWARSLLGWRRFGNAAPNPAHQALAKLESLGFLQHLLTQNVDGLHRQAGHSRVIDLHGRLDRVICLSCGNYQARHQLQAQLEDANPSFSQFSVDRAPDGDAHLENAPFQSFRLIGCQTCGGVLKPDIVFYGENVPLGRVEQAMSELQRSSAMLVVGSSLMVYSAFRFCRRAQELELPIAAINLGKTRADKILEFKLEANCSKTLVKLLGAIRS